MVEVKVMDQEGIKDVPVPDEVKEKMFACFQKEMDKFIKVSKKREKIVFNKLLVLVTDKKQILSFGSKHLLHNLQLIYIYLKLKMAIKSGAKSLAWDNNIFLFRGLTKASKYIGMSEAELMKRYVEKAKGCVK